MATRSAAGARLADPGWNFQAAFARYRAGYKIQLDADASIRGSRTGELIARCMVETGTSSYYTALAESTDEPALKQVCKLIAADEYRHFKLFYDHMQALPGARTTVLPAGGCASPWAESAKARMTSSPIAFHCGNEPEGMPYDHDRCIAGYMGRAMGFYRSATSNAAWA